ncbi:hypothetical protein [Marinobacterium arenosum]|uniref:hypothetical protein n=1 Tax=Marinobacterium arenosum TaxID=2862496 RepID=UPI001C966154|nr:hypothetical protein [Marinobacterium arenosum]MBY4677623.1 hypothetical protein [Marinobacterium arenosum]
MKGFSIGIIGGGHAAIELLHQLMSAEFVEIVGIADLKTDAPGIELARAHNIRTTSRMADLLELGEQVDILIDVTGVPAVREQLRQHMQQSDNRHTVIMHERISALMVSLAKGQLISTHDSDYRY